MLGTVGWPAGKLGTISKASQQRWGNPPVVVFTMPRCLIHPRTVLLTLRRGIQSKTDAEVESTARSPTSAYALRGNHRQRDRIEC